MVWLEALPAASMAVATSVAGVVPPPHFTDHEYVSVEALLVLATCLPSMESVRALTPTLSEATIWTLTTLATKLPPVGWVIDTVGAIVSPDVDLLEAFATVTLTLAEFALLPAAS